MSADPNTIQLQEMYGRAAAKAYALGAFQRLLGALIMEKQRRVEEAKGDAPAVAEAFDRAIGCVMDEARRV